jgi:hypothetical protein
MGTPGFCLAAFVVTHRIGRDQGVLLFASVRLLATNADLPGYGYLPPQMH